MRAVFSSPRSSRSSALHGLPALGQPTRSFCRRVAVLVDEVGIRKVPHTLVRIEPRYADEYSLDSKRSHSGRMNLGSIPGYYYGIV
jgi:hypothetical protein